ncbi:c-type cytochrome [Kordiimonas sp.]|jgi:mono/diheme cytochrome c family protein|uniref:c-type cytochrome n=1 Tax=Kordiimonas sp. TaxID=1970157 RepID=UPI003A9586D3
MNRRSLLIIAAVAILGFGGYYYFNQPADPDGGGAPLVNVSIPSLTQSQQVGAVAYAENCAACHGINAAGQEGVAPPLVHKIYEPSHHGDRAFFMAALNGVRAHHWPFGNMPPVEGVTQQDVASIVEYVRALQRANGIN